MPKNTRDKTFYSRSASGKTAEIRTGYIIIHTVYYRSTFIYIYIYMCVCDLELQSWLYAKKKGFTLLWILTCPRSCNCSCCHQWTLGWLGEPWRCGDTPLPFPFPDCAGSDWIPLPSCFLLLWIEEKQYYNTQGFHQRDKGTESVRPTKQRPTKQKPKIKVLALSKG